MEDDQDPNQEPRPESLLPYDEWTEEALRQVMMRALRHAAANGLPGQHHFYVTFRTDHPGVTLPPRLKVQYPQEMTIVLQHQYWDLRVDESGILNVGLSFGGVPATLGIPPGAITAFADPYVSYGLRFRPAVRAMAEPDAVADPVAAAPPDAGSQPDRPQVVSLDAFRRKPPARD